MFSADLKVTIEPLVRGIRNAMRSEEGLVYKFGSPDYRVDRII